MGHGSMGIRLSVKNSLILEERCDIVGRAYMMVTIQHVVLLTQLHVNRTCGITYSTYMYNMYI